MSGDTATIERSSQATVNNDSRPIEPLIEFGVVICPVPGMVCNVYSRSSNQLLCQVTFLSYVRPAQVDGAGFQTGDLLVDILGEDKPTQARALGIWPFGKHETDYVSPLYCVSADG